MNCWIDRVVAGLYLLRSAGRLDLAVVEHGDSIGNLVRRDHIVGDGQRGGVEAIVEVEDQIVDLVGENRIEAGGGLVVENDLRFERNGPRQPDALLHAAGELGGHLVLDALEPHPTQHLTHPLLHPSLRPVALLTQRESDVVADVHRVE